MNYKVLYILLFGFMACLFDTNAQDLHFSQYFNAPILVNPANTGFNPDNDYRIGGNYRNQWSAVGSPYKTMSVWGDAQLFTGKFENGWMGVGGAIYRDAAGSGNLINTSAYASVAYHQMLGYSSLLSIGFTGGFISKKIDIAKLSFDNQWNGKFFDAALPSNEPFAFSQTSYADLQAGINYAYFSSEKFYLNAGLSAQHINRPKESFFDPLVSDASIDMRYTAFLNASIKVGEYWIVNPNVYISKMNTASELVVGVNANRDLSGDGSQQMILGIYFRNSDAVVPVFGFQLNDTRFTFNYDATVSTLKSANNTRGAYELSIVKTGVISSALSRGVRCPSVKF
jgi:type IX secretion system PorP/SprF family membrane protein